MSDRPMPPTKPVPPEQLTAWQRWELPTFGDNRPVVRAGTAELPTASQLEAIQHQAHEEGFQAGYAEGLQKAGEENRRLAALIDALEQQVDEQMARQLLDLSLDIAQQMLRQALKVNPALLLGVVSEAIGALPHFSQGALLILHPADAALVRERMGEQLEHSGWKIFEDPRVERGGARIENTNTQIDASLETRWKRIGASLGRDTSWLIQE